MGDGIAVDIFHLFITLLSSDLGVQEHQVTNGIAGAPFKLLSAVNRVIPAFTIVNSGTTTVNIGFKGTASFPLPAGASITLRWKNPQKLNIVVDDLGTKATIDIIG